MSPPFLGCFWSDPFYICKVTRTCMKSRTSSNFGQIGPPTTELSALECLKISHRLIMGKCCLHASSFILIESSSKLLVTRTGIKARASLISGQIRLLTLELLALEWRKFLHFRTWICLRPVGQSWSIICVASLGVEKGCKMFWGRLDEKSGVHRNRKPLWTYNGDNGVSIFSRLLLIRSFLYLQVTRTCI